MASLAFKVEVAFTTQPFAASPSWTDITTYVIADSIENAFGRSDEFPDVQPATLRLRLKNFDGRFTMGNTAGAYYPNVKIGRRVRVTTTYNAVAYVRFDGHVNQWPTQWLTPRATHAYADITATDRLKRYGQIGELRSILEEDTLLDGPTAYYPLTEPSDATSVGNISKTIQGAGVLTQTGSGGMIDFGAGAGPLPDELSAPLFNRSSGTNGQYIEASLPTPVTSTTGVTLECWFSILNNADAQYLAELTADKDATFGSEAFNIIHLTLAASGTVAARRYISTNVYSLTSAANYDDGRLHHLALTESISGTTVTARFYIDGVEDSNTTYTRDDVGSYTRIFMGYRPGNVGTFNLYAGTLAHVAAHPTALSAARVLSHYQAGFSGGAGERTDQRLGRIADWMAIPSADRTFDTGDSSVGAQATSGQQPLEAARQVVGVEGGVLFINPADGDLTFHNRSRRYNTSPAFTLDTAAQHVQATLGFGGDDFGMTNDMTVTRPAGSTARSVNTTSIDEYGLYRDAAELPMASDADAQALANWRVGAGGTPINRLPTVEVSLSRLDRQSVSLVASVMAATIGTKIRLANLPAVAPSATVDGFVEGWTEQFRPRDWRLVFNLSPAEGSQVWQLATSGFSELGTTTKLAR